MKEKRKNSEINTDHFNVMREIDKKPGASQRELAYRLGLAWGNLIIVYKHYITKD